MIHKINNHPEERAVLLVPSFMLKLPTGLTDAGCNEIFDKVIKYKWEFQRFISYPNDVFGEIEQAMAESMGEFWRDEITEYNIFYAARFFGSFLVYNKIHFNWFEEADGRYENPYPPMQDDMRMYKERYELASIYGLYTAENDLIDNIFIAFRANSHIQISEKMIDFAVNDELEKMDSDEVKKILKFWGADCHSNTVQPNSVLLLTQHFCNVKIITFEEQALLYQMTVDYYIPGAKLYIKLHPSDLFPYNEYLSNCTYIDADYPSELLQYTCDGIFDKVIAVSSTGANNLNVISKSQLVINEEYITGFVDNDLYYFAVKLINLSDCYNIFAIGLNEAHMQAMLETYQSKEKKVVYMEDDIENIPKKKNLIFLGNKYSDGNIKMLEPLLREGCTCVWLSVLGNFQEWEFLKKNITNVKIIESCSKNDIERKILSQKAVYICTEDSDMIERINNMSYEKILENSGIVVNVEANGDKDLQINILRGMLQETENALKKAVMENQILKETLASYDSQ